MYNEKFKKVIGVLFIFVLLGFLGVMGYRSYIDYHYNAPFAVKQAEFKYEYGSEIPKEVTEYIDITDEVKYKDEDVSFQNEADVMKVGKYDCKINWRKVESNFVIIVEDTQFPVIEIEKKEIKIKYAEEYDISKNVKSAKDIVDGNVDYKIEGELDCKKEGKQVFKVIAVDKNGNETTEEFTVEVGKKPAWPKTYEDDTCKITITKEWYKSAWCYVAHLQFTDYDRLKTACANGGFKQGNETTSAAAKRLGAIFCVNGDYSADSRGGIVRDGKTHRDPGYSDAAGVYNQKTGIFEYGLGLGKSLTSLTNSGRITDTMSFCNSSVYIKNGVVQSNRWGKGRAQRTFIGTNGKPGDIYIVVSDGRYNDGDSPGLTYWECGAFLKTKGCTFAVPLDGGGSSTMVFEGEVLNAAKGNERAVVDFVYFK